MRGALGAEAVADAAREAARDALALEASGDVFLEARIRAGTVEVFSRPEALLGKAGTAQRGLVDPATLYGIIHPDDRQQLVKELMRAFTTGAQIRMRVRVRPSGGELRHFLLRGRVPVDERGERDRFVAALSDVTAEVEERRALEDRADSFRVAETMAGIGTWEHDLIANVGSYDEGMLRILGVTEPPDFDAFLETVHPEDRGKVIAGVSRAIADGVPYHIQVRIRQAGGEVRWFEARAQVDTDFTGRGTRVRGVAVDISEAKRQESTIALYADIVRNTPVGVVVWHFDEPYEARSLRLMAANAAAATISRRPMGELVGKRAAEVFPRLFEKPDFPDACVEVARSGQSRHLDGFRFDEADGTSRTFSVLVFPLPDQCVGVWFEDVTEYGRAVEALAESEERFRRFAEESEDVFWFVELSPLRFLYVSPGSERITGLRPEQIYADPVSWLGVIHPDDVRRVRREVATHMTAGAAAPTKFTFDFRTLCPDGETHTIRARGVVTPARGAHPASASGVAEDITRRKRTEQNERFLGEVGSALAESLDCTRTLNRVAQLAVPYLADSFTVELLDKDGKPNRFGEGGTPDGATPGADTIQFPLEVRGARVGSITLGVVPPRRFDTSDLGIIGEVVRRSQVAVDNSILYHDAHDAIRLRDEFLSIASHELRTPLTALHLAIQGLKLATPAPRGASADRALDVASRQVVRLAGLVDELLNVSRIQAGRLTIDRKRTDIVSIVRDAIQASRLPLSRAGCEVAFMPEQDGPIEGFWDSMWLGQVVTNLLGNAVKFGPNKPVHVILSADAERVRLSVRDSGIGIPSSRLPYIFDRFERAVSPREYGGLGLGLYIVRGIVEAHGGRVWAVSTPGVGSTFTVELPRFEGPENPNARAE